MGPQVDDNEVSTSSRAAPLLERVADELRAGSIRREVVEARSSNVAEKRRARLVRSQPELWTLPRRLTNAAIGVTLHA